jgi:alkaline phosphatase
VPSRIRNKIIFLTCLLFFVAGGFLVYRYWVMQRPFAVILFVSENFTPSTLSAARLFAGGADYRFGMESLPHMALASPRARDYAVADVAAAASAIATGQLVNRGTLSATPEGQTLETLIDQARRAGRATGLVSNTPLTEPATAAFYAAGFDPAHADALAVHLLEKAPLDLVLGGGAAQMVPTEQGGTRQDGRDLLLEARQRGYDIVRTREELESTPGWRSPQVFGIFAEGDLAFAEDASRYPSQPSLSDLVRRAIELLQFNNRGYFLVVNAGLAGRAAQVGRGESLLREIAALDEAVETARRFAGEKALILVSGLVNTGGLQLNAFSFSPDRGIAVLGPSATGLPALSWSTGPAAKPDAPIIQSVAIPTDRPVPTSEDAIVLGSVGFSPEQPAEFLGLAHLNRLLWNKL